MYGYLIGLTPTRLSGTGNRRWGGKSNFKVEPFNNTVHTHCAPSQPNTPITRYIPNIYTVYVYGLHRNIPRISFAAINKQYMQ